MFSKGILYLSAPLILTIFISFLNCGILMLCLSYEYILIVSFQLYLTNMAAFHIFI